MDLKDIKKLLTKEGLQKFYKGMTPAQHFVAGFILVVLMLGVVRLICDPGHQKHVTVESASELVADAPQAESKTDAASQHDAEEEASQPEAEEQPADAGTMAQEEPEVPKELKRPYYTRPIVRWNEKEFSDLNDLQLLAAKRNGIKPVSSRADADTLLSHGVLVFSGASPLFIVDRLNNSIPYLVPKAHRLLSRVALNYIDSLKSKGLPAHKIIVTSLLRTHEDVGKLKRHNGNAATQSCHEYGTTFDITYVRFGELEEDPMKDHTVARGGTMKQILGQVLRDLRYEGRCYVKHETKQSCFHVTVR